MRSGYADALRIFGAVLAVRRLPNAYQSWAAEGFFARSFHQLVVVGPEMWHAAGRFDGLPP